MTEAAPAPSAPARPRLVEALRGRSTLSAMLLTAVAVGLFLFLVQWASPVLAPLFLGLFITALTAPVFAWLLDRGRSPLVALVITVGGVLLVGGAIVLLALTSAAQLRSGIDAYSDQIVGRYPELSRAFAVVGMRSSASSPPSTCC